MPTGSRHGVDNKVADLGREFVEFGSGETAEVLRPGDALEMHGARTLSVARAGRESVPSAR